MVLRHSRFFYFCLPSLSLEIWFCCCIEFVADPNASVSPFTATLFCSAQFCSSLFSILVSNFNQSDDTRLKLFKYANMVTGNWMASYKWFRIKHSFLCLAQLHLISFDISACQMHYIATYFLCCLTYLFIALGLFCSLLKLLSCVSVITKVAL